MLKFIKNYFSEKFTPAIRYLHFSIAILIIVQIVISNFLKISDTGVISQQFVAFYSTWGHFIIGLLLLLLALIFVTTEISRRGFSYFYPYLSGDISQLKNDVVTLKTFNIPEARPKGLAAIIQGLGLGALLLIVISGTVWLLLWLYGSAIANDAREVHQILTGLIEAYLIGHGGLAFIHLYIEYKKR